MTSSGTASGYLFVALTLAFTIYGQLVIKWQVALAGPAPAAAFEKMVFVAMLFLRPWVISGFVAAGCASVCWMLVLTKLPLAVAYPYMSLSFVFVVLLSNRLFGEVVLPVNLVGMVLLIAGVALVSKR